MDIKIFGLGFSVIIAGLLWYVHPMLHPLPAPTGRYTAGITSECWLDDHRKDPYKPDQQRELSVRWWYPTHATHDKPHAPYLYTLRDSVSSALAKQLHIPARIVNWLLNNTSHAIMDAPVADDAVHYPLIIFSHGFSSIPEEYSALLEEVTSHGYIVLGINHTYISTASILCDSRLVSGQDPGIESFSLEQIVQIMVDDIQFVINTVMAMTLNSTTPLYQKIDIHKVGIMGHSMGGVTALKACQIDDRIKAGIDMDGWVIGLQDLFWQQQTPFLFLLGQYGLLSSPIPTDKELQDMGMTQQSWIEQGEQGLKEIRQLCSANPQCRVETVPDASHVEFCDWALIKKPFDHFLFPSWSRLQSQDAYALIADIRKNVVTFFNEWL